MDNIKKALDKFGKDYVYELTSRLIRYDKRATGNLINSIDYELLSVSNEIIDNSVKWTLKNYTGIRIIAANYLINVDEGRRPGLRPPPIAPIQNWIRARKIKFRDRRGRFITNLQTAYIITRSIARKGIKPTNVLDETRAAMLNKLNGIKEAYGQELLIGLYEVLKNI